MRACVKVKMRIDERKVGERERGIVRDTLEIRYGFSRCDAFNLISKNVLNYLSINFDNDFVRCHTWYQEKSRPSDVLIHPQFEYPWISKLNP